MAEVRQPMNKPKRTTGKVITAPPAGPSPVRDYFQKHGNKILLAITVVLLLVFLIRFRLNAARQATEQAAANLAVARQSLSQLQSADSFRMLPEQIANVRRSAYDGIEEAVNAALRDSDDSKVRAAALLLRGDANWTLANASELPGATTQPSLALPLPAADYLKTAEDAYNTIVTQHADQPVVANAARFGLAAIAENQGAWDVAQKQYDAVVAATDAPKSLKDLAGQKLKVLAEIRNPIWVQPATAPAATQSGVPFLEPATTAPAVAAPAPTTAPATIPAP
jgi:hypothetical protein